MDKRRKLSSSLPQDTTLTFVPQTEAEKILVKALNAMLDISVARAPMWGMNMYGIHAKEAISKLNKLKQPEKS